MSCHFLQALKYSSKSHPSGGDHRHDKMRDATDPSPPNKMLRRSDSPENKYGDNTGHSKAKSMHTHRVRERDGGELNLTIFSSGAANYLHLCQNKVNTTKAEATFQVGDCQKYTDRVCFSLLYLCVTNGHRIK